MHISSLFINTAIFLLLISGFSSKEKFFPPKFFHVLSSLMLLWCSLSAILYVLTPSYFSYIEAHIANLSAYWLRGHGLYTELLDKNRYSMLYGPWPVISEAIFLLPGVFTIPASKLMGLLNLLITMILFSKLFPKQKFFFLGILCLCFMGFDNYSYTNRPDSFLIAYTVAALFLLEHYCARNSLRIYVFVGVLCGLCEASKIHGFIYFLPIAAFCFEKKPETWSWRLFLLTILMATVFSFLPFLLPQINFWNFYQWLRATSRHGLSFSLFVDNVTYATPYLVGLYLCGFSNMAKKTYLVLVLSVFVACLFGSLVGAGTHHLLPFIPLIIYFGSYSYFSLDERQKTKAQIFLSAFLLALTYDAFISQKAMVKYFATVPEQIRQFKDLKVLRSKVSGPVEIGYGENRQLEMSYFKPHFVAHGDSLLVESDALMDMGASRIPLPESTFRALKTCQIPYMILPKGGKPWTLTSGFGFRLFPDDWINEFQKDYSPIENSEYYSLYQCTQGELSGCKAKRSRYTEF